MRSWFLTQNSLRTARGEGCPVSHGGARRVLPAPGTYYFHLGATVPNRARRKRKGVGAERDSSQHRRHPESRSDRGPGARGRTLTSAPVVVSVCRRYIEVSVASTFWLILLAATARDGHSKCRFNISSAKCSGCCGRDDSSLSLDMIRESASADGDMVKEGRVAVLVRVIPRPGSSSSPPHRHR